MINLKTALFVACSVLSVSNAYAKDLGFSYQDFKNSLNKKYGFGAKN